MPWSTRLPTFDALRAWSERVALGEAELSGAFALRSWWCRHNDKSVHDPAYDEESTAIRFSEYLLEAGKQRQRVLSALKNPRLDPTNRLELQQQLALLDKALGVNEADLIAKMREDAKRRMGRNKR